METCNKALEEFANDPLKMPINVYACDGVMSAVTDPYNQE